ncbi:hypothetical protein [Oceanobacillus profundus]|nr:hypothetical protein [Oceanobacillus profundus]
MKVKQLIEELQVRNPNATVYLLNDEGDKAAVNKLFRIESDKPTHEQDVLLTERF